MFCKHQKARILYVSRKTVNAHSYKIYYCPECRKYARFKAEIMPDGSVANVPKMVDLKWRKDLGDITNYTYLGGY